MKDLLELLEQNETLLVTIESIGVLTAKGKMYRVLNNKEIDKELFINFLREHITKEGGN